MPKVNALTLSTPNLDTLLLNVQNLAREVFEPEISPLEYESRPTQTPQLLLENWMRRLKLNDAAIFYVTADEAKGSVSLAASTDKGTMSSSSEAAVPVLGFFFNHPRLLSNPDSKPSYHIYLAAIHSSARGRGLFRLLLGATKQQARDSGNDTISVGTIPGRFHRMYSILSKKGSGWEEVERKQGANGEGHKVVMKMTLSVE